MEDLSGRTFRGYEIIERVGAGGFGVVYRARQHTVRREVAVKVILPEFADHPDFTERFETEAQIVARLEHPYIIPLHDYWRDDDGAFLVMRWLNGGSLRERLDGGPLELTELARLLEQIGEALAFAHAQEIIHRDLKPGNILLDEAENAYLTDFGIAKDLSGPGVTETGKIMGSVDYLSPEQAKGEPITPRTDIYALGLMLYELLTGQHPFPNLTPIQMIQKQLNEPLPSIAEKRPDLPRWVDEIIGRATAKSPGDRYPDVEALISEFREALLRGHERALQDEEPELPAFLIAGQKRPSFKRDVFVGRQQELAALNDALGTAVEGQGKVVFIVGNAGRGKTALLGEFTQRAQKQVPDLLVASGSCNAHSGVGDPYLPFRQMLEMLTGDVERSWLAGQITTDQASRLWSNLRIATCELAESAPDLINRLVPGPALIARAEAAGASSEVWWTRLEALAHQERLGSGDLEQTLLFEQCSRFFRSLSQNSPLLLILDDLQWGDAASIGLLFHLGRSITSSPILIAAAYRPDELALGRASPTTGLRERHPLESVINELTRTHGDITLDLAQEDGTNGRAFVDAFLDTEPNELDEAFRRALFEHTGGHSLFTVELLRTMQERGDLVRDEKDRWVLGTELDWQILPARVEAVIAERIGRLDNELRQMISVASVEGEEFTAQVVARVRELPEARALHDLAEEIGRRHRLVREHGEVRAGSELLARFKFAHHLFQRYLYNHLSSGERRLLHRQIAEVLEDLYGEQAAEIGVALAYHYREAGYKEKALPYLIQVGDYARDRYANDEAEGYYRAALDLTTEDLQRAGQLRELGRILGRKGQFAEGIEVWKEAIKLYQSSEEWSEVAWLYARSARETSLAGDEPGALNICLKGLSAVPAGLKTADMAALLHETGRAYWFNGKPEEAVPLCEQALGMAKRLQAVEVQADTLATRGVLPDLNPDEALVALVQAVELAESAGLHRIASRAHHNLGYILSDWGVGSLSEARDHEWLAAEIQRERGNLLGQIGSLRNYADTSMRMGELEEADRTINNYEQIQIAFGSIEQQDERIQADRMIYRGHLREAVERLEELRVYFSERGDLQREFDSMRLMGSALGELHEFSKAIEVLEEAVQLSDSQHRVRKVTSRATLSRISSLAGDVQRAQQALGEAREIAGQKIYATEKGCLSWASAQLSAAEGDWPEALKNFEEAAVIFERLENRWEQSRVIRGWAEVYIARGEEGDVGQAQTLLERVRKMYDKMEMSFYSVKVSERLKSLPDD